MTTPRDVALHDGGQDWTRAALDGAANALADRLRAEGVRVLATLMDNSPAWVAADLAARLAGVVHVPLPAFFTASQVLHALRASGTDAVLADPALATALVAGLPSAGTRPCVVMAQALSLCRLPAVPVRLPAGTTKITFTSGTTGAPKGVCLDDAALSAVAGGIADALRPLAISRHLCALPFAVLLENVAGLLAPLSESATCIVVPLRDLGLAGSSSFDPAVFHAAVTRHAPHSLILLPQMLRAWTLFLERSGLRAPACLKFVAVGGAAVGTRTIEAARARGIPAHEGYGLSEGASVQTLNLPGADRPGSAGRPLPHARVRVGASGGIEVAGSLFLGYLGETAAAPREWWPTGDAGRLDADGFLHVEGRQRDVLITGFGRNVSPEWVETALRAESPVAQAVVLGDGRPMLGAVLWPSSASVTDAALEAAVRAANAGLPDYARVGRWVRGRAAFDAASGMSTANGRPRREAVAAMHADSLWPAASTGVPHQRIMSSTGVVE